MPQPSFWQDKRVLLTGHTGFKGSWLAIWLHQLGAKVIGLGLPQETAPNLFELSKVEELCASHFCDIRDEDSVKRLVHSSNPEIVLHLAAQPLVRASYRQPVETFSANFMGTVHVLNALRKVDSVRVAVMITTDKVYKNSGSQWPFREDDRLGGHDPYSASKAASEICISCYRDSYLSHQGVALASARAGNVIGGGDWSEDRLIPDAIRAWQVRKKIDVRNPQSLRPWQHVVEPLAGYLMLAEKLWSRPELADAYNFGPNTHEASTVQAVIELAQSAHGSGEALYANEVSGPHEAGCLSLEITKARKVVGFSPAWDLAETVHRTMAWYRAQAEGKDARELCLHDIRAYEASI